MKHFPCPRCHLERIPPVLGAICPRCNATLTRVPWVGVDFDGTLAASGTGNPVPRMVTLVRQWLEAGAEVRIFTARHPHGDLDEVRRFCRAQFGRELPTTNVKDEFCYQIWDDRAVRVAHGIGRIDQSPNPWNPIPRNCLR